MTSNPKRAYLQKSLKQLDDPKDILQLNSILLQKLCYPSTQLACIHTDANRLGTLDVRKDSKSGEANQSKESQQNIKAQDGINTKQQKKQKIKHCRCCALPRQPQKVGILTGIDEVKNVGISTRLFFIAYEHSIINMFLVFFVYGIYTIISNVRSCNYQASNLLQAYQTPRYLNLINEWTFQVSLLAHISCMTSTTAYEIQCWLGVVVIILLIITMTALKYRKLRACISLGKISKSVQNLSIFIQNMPANISKVQLQRQLREYQQNMMSELKQEQDKKQINIVKVNRAAPLYLSKHIFSLPEIKEINKKYQRTKQKIIKIVKQRRKSPNFALAQQQRKQIYQQFQQVKRQRIQVYKKQISQKLKSKQQQHKHKIVTAPAFVTFASSFNSQFILRYNSGLLPSSHNFHFTIPKTDVKIRAQISIPPKPQQIIWTNLGQQRSAIIKKKILILIVTLIFLCGTCAGLYFLQKYNFQYALSNIGKTSTLYLSLAVSFIIVIVAYFASAVLLILVKRQRNITYMHEQQSLNNKIILSQVGNFLLVPIIFNLFFRVRYTGVVSLSQIVFFLGLQNAYVFPILKVFDIMYLFNRLRKYFASKPTNKLAQSQVELNHKFQFMIFNVGFQFGYLVRLILFTCFFAPLQPIIIVFSVTGVILMYWIEKYCLYKRCIRPIPGNRIVNISINKYLVLGPILFGIGCLIWPYYINQQIIALAPCIVMIVLSVIHLLIPFQIIIDKLLQKAKLRQRQKQKPIEILYSKQKFNFKTEYDRLNYMTSYEATRQYLQQLQEHNDKVGANKQLTSQTNYVGLVFNMIKGNTFYQTFNDNSVNLKRSQKMEHHIKLIKIQSLKKLQSNKTIELPMNVIKNEDEEQQDNLAQQQNIVYSNQHNDNQILIQQILQTIKQHFFQNNKQTHGDFQTDLIRHILNMHLPKSIVSNNLPQQPNQHMGSDSAVAVFRQFMVDQQITKQKQKQENNNKANYQNKLGANVEVQGEQDVRRQFSCGNNLCSIF